MSAGQAVGEWEGKTPGGEEQSPQIPPDGLRAERSLQEGRGEEMDALLKEGKQRKDTTEKKLMKGKGIKRKAISHYGRATRGEKKRQKKTKN